MNASHQTTLPMIPELIEAAAAAHPDQTAIIGIDETITYAELCARANQLARFLEASNIGPGDRVGVLFDQSVDFVVSALGILKAGAAYLPIGAFSDRVAWMIQDAGLDYVISAPGIRSSVTLRTNIIDLCSSDITSQNSGVLERTIETDNTAYLIYTSGTTGTPKCVEITHGNLQHIVSWHKYTFKMSAEDRSLLLANIGFDASVWELWPYLASGATLLVPGPELIRDPVSLRDWIVDRKVTITFIPTLLAEALMDLEWPSHTALRFMLTGGDTLRHYPRPGLPFRLFNNYGLTECTVVSTSGEVLPSIDAQQLPHIGYAIEGTQIYFLDQDLSEVAPGKEAEICIGGRGVGRGYLNRPELTSQKFVTIERSDGAHRVYRTGDLGRLNSDLSIQFLGRLDDQVQLRGYRIECGEIEAALNALPPVRASTVVARKIGAGDLRLIAYLVPADGAVLSRKQLRHDLRTRLPEYMVPPEFVRLQAMPVSENGKVDRQQLPEPNEANLITSLHSENTPIETEVITILQSLLSIQQLDREDNFFLLGGHSFFAAQLIARIRSRFAVDVNLKTVFDHPTAMAIAEKIEEHILTKR